ncbi:MAG TPA: hypothetical protein PK821_07395, partial [Victivallales bacterium]|nr:hypothetical protein [Victivallales bacterium]
LNGTSAGACSSLWLALHDDMADPESEDPVLRESTKPTCVAAVNGQTYFDPEWIKANIGWNANRHRMAYLSFGSPSALDMLNNNENYQDLIYEFSPISHVDADDPPVYLQYGSDLTVPAPTINAGIHHGIFGIELKKRADIAGMECYLNITNYSQSIYPSALKFIKVMLSR